MTEHFQYGEFAKFGQGGFDAYGRSFGEWNKGLQAIAAEWTEYSKKAFEDYTKAFQEIVGGQSVENAQDLALLVAPRRLRRRVGPVVAHGGEFSGISSSHWFFLS